MKTKPSLKKILVAVDGSERSLNTIRSIARFEPFHKMHLVLYHVYGAVPEGFYDLETDLRSIRTIAAIKAWEAQQKVNMREYMKRAHQFLLKAGFPSESVEVKTQQRKKGIARDIIEEARKGYFAVITRRRGLGALRSIVMGSVAAKLVEKLSFIPLILDGRKPSGTKLLLAFDGSETAMRAVDFVGLILGGFEYNVELIHVIRGKETKKQEFQRIYSPEEYTELTQKKMAPAMDKAKANLVDFGFKPAAVTTKIITGVTSRASAIVSYAKHENYGTIVMGRKGLSRLRDFFIGRVTNKVIHIARDRTVWVIR